MTLPRKQPMKRGTKGLARKTPMPAAKKRMPKVSKKTAEKNQAAKPMFAQLEAEKDRCDCCGIHISYCKDLENHHMLDGKWGRPHDRRNILRLCVRWDRVGCHFLVDGATNKWPKLTLAIQLTIKAEKDQEHYDPAWMQSVMKNVALPEPEPIPQMFLDERILNA